ncbi:Ig-like domain-containing protein [Candidatus Daviesbacteria bacterium]|nr:Ig-like domain-containing protein [Candidatus Daviesbacteria bacterium]
MALNLREKKSASLLVLSAVGLVIFILISSSGQFKEGVFGRLFLKSSSQAAESRLSTIFDFQAPQVSISYPVKGGMVRTNTVVEIAAIASDNIRLSKIEFLVAGNSLCHLSAAEKEGRYVCNWSVPKDLGMTYSVVVKASDIAGNSSSQSISVTSK